MKGIGTLPIFSQLQTIEVEKRKLNVLRVLLVYDEKGMMDIAVDFYKKLFAKESDANVKLGPSFCEDNDKVTADENKLLVAPFLEEEIKNALSSFFKGFMWAAQAARMGYR